MTEIASSEGARYWAFISYSHKDAGFGRRLHRRLESYIVPRRLRGRAVAQGLVPKRLSPIFRDREELPAAHDLSAEVRAALKASRSLIVVCSPSAAASQWVSREVELFRALHPDRPVLAALTDGEPAEAFPQALRQAGPDGGAIEPLAADFRRGRDGAELGLLKLVAGILGLGLDELVQRDAQRRTQRVTAVTAAALAAMVVMGVLTAFALNARREAEHQRAEAEGLVEFMLTDLRTTLKGVGRLDAMTAVNERALRYYSDQDLSRLPAESLERRARILHAMGEDDLDRGNNLAALALFHEARRTTATLLAEVPNSTDRTYNQAQSDAWIGIAEFKAGHYAAAKTSFTEYKQWAEKLLLLDPGSARSYRELGFADGNLCSVALKPPLELGLALGLCKEALVQMEAAARRTGQSREDLWNLATRHSWLATAYLANKDNKNARLQLLEQEKILAQLASDDPKNMLYKSSWVALQRILSWIDLQSNNREAARLRLQNAASTLNSMIALDPSNKTWERQRQKVNADMNELAKSMSRGDDSDTYLKR